MAYKIQRMDNARILIGKEPTVVDHNGTPHQYFKMTWGHGTGSSEARQAVRYETEREAQLDINKMRALSGLECRMVLIKEVPR